MVMLLKGRNDKKEGGHSLVVLAFNPSPFLTVKWLSAWEWGTWNFKPKTCYLNGLGDTLVVVMKSYKAYRWYLWKDGWLEAKFHIDEQDRRSLRSRFLDLFRCFVIKEGYVADFHSTSERKLEF